MLAQTVLGCLWVTIAGRMSDGIGRKRMYMIGCVIMPIFGFVYFALRDTQIRVDHFYCRGDLAYSGHELVQAIRSVSPGWTWGASGPAPRRNASG